MFVESDGVTLAVDLTRSDLMLETELPRFAEAIDRSGNNGKRLFRLTPASLARARDYGMTVPQLETWFTQRTGQPCHRRLACSWTGPRWCRRDWFAISFCKWTRPTGRRPDAVARHTQPDCRTSRPDGA